MNPKILPTQCEFLKESWHRLANIPYHPPKKINLSLDQIYKSQWNSWFESMMRNRLAMGAFRYGLFGSKDKGNYDNIGSAIRRLKKYEETGNVEYLIDSANLCMVEYVEGRHPNKHFSSVDDGEHTKKIGVCFK